MHSAHRGLQLGQRSIVHTLMSVVVAPYRLRKQNIVEDLLDFGFAVVVSNAIESLIPLHV